MPSLFAELKRRNVLRAAAFYAAAAWLLVQVATQVFPFFDMPNWTVRWIVIAVLIGFPFAMVFAWFYEFTPQGLKRESEIEHSPSIERITGKKVDRWIIAMLAFAVVLLLTNNYILRTRGTGAGEAVSTKSIAVLPFVNMSGDAQTDYFSDGITDEILNALAQIPGLKVAGRTSAFAFKGKAQDLRKIGETLGVANVLEGSVQRSGDDVRITAQLIDTRDGYHRWSQKYDRKLTSIFEVEDEISKAIAKELQVALGGDVQAPLVKQATGDPKAHELYLKALTQMSGRGAGLVTATQSFEEAVALDPGYAAGWAGLSQTYELLPWYDLAPWLSSLAKAEAAARRALALDPGLAEAHTALANVQRDRLDFVLAEKEYRQALTLGPGSAETRNQFAQLLGALGRFEEAIEQARVAVELDPIAPAPRYILGVSLSCAHRQADAIAEFDKVMAKAPDFLFGRYHLAFAYLFDGNYAEAEGQARGAATAGGEDPDVIATLIKGVADPKAAPAALKLTRDVHRLAGAEVGELAVAFWESLLGAHEQALESLQRWFDGASVGQRFNGIRYLWLPAFDPVRADPRFKDVLRALNVPEQSAKSPAS
jgi:TolB-like protein/Flp pilus assembly protein TadD